MDLTLISYSVFATTLLVAAFCLLYIRIEGSSVSRRDILEFVLQMVSMLFLYDFLKAGIRFLFFVERIS